jgi:hypothetical protein
MGGSLFWKTLSGKRAQENEKLFYAVGNFLILNIF